MSYTTSVLRRLSGALSGDATGSVTADALDTRSVPVAIASPNTEVLMTIGATECVLFFVQTDKALTLYANAASGGAPDFNIAVAANTGYLWCSADGTTSPITADVTKWYITATGSGTATVTISAMQDSTP